MATRGRPPFDDVLTPSEWKVVEGVRHGLTNPQIARRLGVGLDAVKYHVANVLQKLGFSGRAQLRGWDGIRRSSALHGRKQRMNPHIGVGPIGQIARSVRDIDAAEAWYRDVLRLPHLYTFGNLAFFDCGGTRLFLSEGESRTDESILYFRVEDIHAARDALVARGVAFVDAPHMIHRHDDGVEEWMAFFRDNEGRPLALMAQVAPATPA
ncbi:DNA-binding CsgD family transcriptional regulator/catechol 2,3-dioxygenase-like lactoylglutathione lyase family enzyme [Dokdonella fugitiva]|uniref:DNA-binding CsgD family transcriptional regulator/catechol 2,3-dioxygenase-like lactoylglutathione lyase family enzyme n=1 Tax=Dokdonella fugitiva TaxID=328517 RepID=A0A839F547_9GAMM|nr:LuxR C-terminal-related transcriptional regulator [Dokdonella fugitiva]MBA8888648.1 DNA-binding CsgD family transcriptional regulator/catechol 2,3-dioxygenase-like lactoylglutathione lyase family enzyme [Dokdonella fugitiva]